MEESTLLCAYLDELDGAPAFAWPAGERGALDYQSQVLGSGWRQGHPKLASWLDEIAQRPSVATTAPPADR